MLLPHLVAERLKAVKPLSDSESSYGLRFTCDPRDEVADLNDADLVLVLFLKLRLKLFGHKGHTCTEWTHKSDHEFFGFARLELLAQ